MSQSHPFFQEAIQIANTSHRRTLPLKQEKASLEDRISQLEAEIEQHEMAADRLRTFTLHRDGVLQCPRCWIVKEVAADLAPIPNDGGDDHFRCSDCHSQFVTPAP